jgi:FKBP-type peptidyl-prolyl cis-trans isomerase
MKLQFLSFAVGLALSAPQFFAADATATSATTNNTPFPNPKDRISYALGVNFGQNLKNQGVEANLELVRKGIEEALAGKPQLNDAQLRETFNELRTQVTAHMEEKKKQAKAEGDKFLAENAKKPGIEKTASGLQYRILTPGSGNTPGTNDEVTVNYTGKLIDGTVFDSSEKQGKPVKFRINGVIRGWTEALLKMKKGAKWELFIPSELAYGERARPSIPANSTLIFTVELVDFGPVAPPPALPTTASQPVTSDIIKVPSAEELKKGAKIEVIKPEDVDKEIAKEKARKEAEEKAAAAQKK